MIWDWKRATMHAPVGAATIVVPYHVPEHMAAVTVITLALGFMAYEVLEAWRLQDHAYKDVQGWLIGLFIGAGGIALW